MTVNVVQKPEIHLLRIALLLLLHRVPLVTGRVLAVLPVVRVPSASSHTGRPPTLRIVHLSLKEHATCLVSFAMQEDDYVDTSHFFVTVNATQLTQEENMKTLLHERRNMLTRFPRHKRSVELKKCLMTKQKSRIISLQKRE